MTNEEKSGVPELVRNQCLDKIECLFQDYGSQLVIKLLGQYLQTVGGGNSYPIGKAVEALADVEW